MRRKCLTLIEWLVVIVILGLSFCVVTEVFANRRFEPRTQTADWYGMSDSELTTYGGHVNNTSNPHSVTKTQVGLSAVPNVNATNPSNIVWNATYRTSNDTEKGQWNSAYGWGNHSTAGYANGTDLSNHTGNTTNPHNVTKSQVGLANVTDVDTSNPVNIVWTSSYNITNSSEKSDWNEAHGWGNHAVAGYAADSNLTAHTGNTSNPHNVTKSQIGLSNVTDVDTTNPANIAWNATYNTTNSTEKSNWNTAYSEREDWDGVSDNTTTWYLGDPAVDDTWAVNITDGNLTFYRRVTGSYVLKSTITK